MAIPEGRLSTDWAATESQYSIPEDRVFYAYSNYERGPIAIEDTSEGLLYQTWTFSWDESTGDITATPETTGSPTVVHNIPACSLISCTFDQNGRVAIAYINGSSYLWWYDSALGSRTTKDLGNDVFSVSLYLDDKRSTQNTDNDMLLWYTKQNAGQWDLFMARQRDRFLTEYPMYTGLDVGFIHNSGMSYGLRGQLSIMSRAPYT